MTESTIKLADLVARINRALSHDSQRLAATRWQAGRDAAWHVWSIETGAHVRGPMAQSELISFALERGALRPWERNRVLVNARGEHVAQANVGGVTATVTADATPFAPESERITTGLVFEGGTESDRT